MSMGTDGEKEQKIVLFAGTSEGRRLAEACAAAGRSVCVCVATEYGGELLPEHPAIRVHQGRMDEAQMLEFLCGECADAVIDATHPYATLVSQTIRRVCDRQKITCIRLLRDSSEETDQQPLIHTVADAAEAAALADRLEGNIFLTTGVKELSVFVQTVRERARLFVRVLPAEQSLAACEAAGIGGRQLICMQGPFSAELNRAMYDYADAKILITKESGAAGGFSDKIAPALARGMHCIVIRRPKESGCSYTEVLRRLGLPESDFAEDGVLYLIGIGTGARGQLTIEADEILRSVQTVFGAKRMLEATGDYPAVQVCEYQSEAVMNYLMAHPQVTRAAVVFSGDVGFYSGADGYAPVFMCGGRCWQTRRVAGLSSVNYFAARLGRSWQTQALCSVHGRSQNLIRQIRSRRKVFSLLNGSAQLLELAEMLQQEGLSQVRLSVGTDLGYDTEQIWRGTVDEYVRRPTEGALCVALFENDDAASYASGNYADAEYIRGAVPLTKEELRAVALSKLRLVRDAVCYDIGAGTGGMTCDMARCVPEGEVIAFERNEQGCALIRQNAKQFGLSNVRLINGSAPECLQDVPAASHAFIGGSGGSLEAIVRCLLQKNPHMRIVIHAVTLETIAAAQALMKELLVTDAEVVSVTVAKAKQAGASRLMESMNPVYVFSFTGAGESNERTEKIC